MNHNHIQIVFRNHPRSRLVTALVRERAEDLVEEFGEIVRGHVVVEKPHRHHHKGQRFHVDVHVTIPGRGLIAGRHGGARHENIFRATNDAFRAIRRQLRGARKRKLTKHSANEVA